MKTTIKEIDGNMVAILSGRLDTAAAPETEEILKPLFLCSNQDIVLDCTNLDYISSSGLRIFLSVLKCTKPRNCHVIISGLKDEIDQIFKMTGFSNLFEFK